MEARQLTEHLQARLLLAASLLGQAVPFAAVLLDLLNFNLTEVLQRDGREACGRTGR